MWETPSHISMGPLPTSTCAQPRWGSLINGSDLTRIFHWARLIICQKKGGLFIIVQKNMSFMLITWKMWWHFKSMKELWKRYEIKYSIWMVGNNATWRCIFFNIIVSFQRMSWLIFLVSDVLINQSFRKRSEFAENKEGLHPLASGGDFIVFVGPASLIRKQWMS